MAERNRFAGYPSAVAFEEPDGKTAVDQLLWGAFVLDKEERQGHYESKDIHGHPIEGQYVRCHIRGRRRDCWIREHDIQDERLLEVIFVDIGQGDGCLVITPEDEQLLVDAGEGDNMYRFLRWRFGRFREPFTFQSAIISHPDKDHYKGFDPFFDDPNIRFETIYHNGIMERFGKDGLGPREKVGRRSYLTELVRNRDELEAFLAQEENWKRVSATGRTSHKTYPKMLHKALSGEKFQQFRMLSAEDGHMPGYGAEKDLSIQVLGPVLEAPTPADGADPLSPRLRWLSSTGKTKNGHSVVLKLKYRNVSLLLGGDLNIPSEHLLLSHHTGMASPQDSLEGQEALVEAAREIFQVDVAKSCHHGSSDFESTYLRATNPLATVVSSGDNEPHSHPRADTLGAIGLYSRGTRPLIFSTELARSAPELIKHPHVLRRDLEKKLAELTAAPENTEAQRERKKRRVEAFQKQMNAALNRSVATYGAINVVSDGRRVIIAQKMERARSKKQRWDIYRLEAEGKGPLRFQSKH